MKATWLFCIAAVLLVIFALGQAMNNIRFQVEGASASRMVRRADREPGIELDLFFRGAGCLFGARGGLPWVGCVAARKGARCEC